MFLISSCSCLCPIHWIQVLSQEWRCSWSSADRQCANYIWVINNFIAWGVAYKKGLMVGEINQYQTTTKHNRAWIMYIILGMYCLHVYVPWNNLVLTHWGRVTHICVGKLTITGWDNGLSPERRQAIISTNAGILLIGPLGTNFSEILIKIQTFSLKKIRLKMSSVKCCSFRLGLNVLSHPGEGYMYTSIN